jgi:energy-coupling factor transport system permease protein
VRAPLPALLVAGGLAAIAFSTDQPLLLAAVLAASILLVRAGGMPPRALLLVAAAPALFLALLNPIAGANGNVILLDGPHWTVIDLQITVEEVAYGLAIGARLLAVTLLVAAFLALVDADRLQAAAGRVVPRSALTVAIATRLVPVLGRDARAIAEAARLRGIPLTGGRPREVVRRTAPLLVPLVASSLERGLDQAEAMTARGYGAGPLTHLAERGLAPAERAAAAVGAGLVALAVGLVVADPVRYAYYPRLARVTDPVALALALAVLAAGAAASRLLRRPA